MSAIEHAQRLAARFGAALSTPAEFRGELSICVANPSQITEVCAYAKSDLGYNMLLDICSVDNYGEAVRWTVVYELFNLTDKTHLRLKVNVSEESSELPTVSSVWRTADWHEREIFDMMGIRFQGHPDLRRILMWDGYPYHPLRKDFPLAGKPTELPEVAFSKAAPLEGGPFVTSAGARDTIAREPRARSQE